MNAERFPLGVWRTQSIKTNELASRKGQPFLPHGRRSHEETRAGIHHATRSPKVATIFVATTSPRTRDASLICCDALLLLVILTLVVAQALHEIHKQRVTHMDVNASNM